MKKNRLFLYISCVLTGVNQNKVKKKERWYSTSILHLRHTSYKSTATIMKHIKRNPKCNKNLRHKWLHCTDEGYSCLVGKGNNRKQQLNEREGCLGGEWGNVSLIK